MSTYLVKDNEYCHHSFLPKLTNVGTNICFNFIYIAIYLFEPIKKKKKKFICSKPVVTCFLVNLLDETHDSHRTLTNVATILRESQ